MAVVAEFGLTGEDLPLLTAAGVAPDIVIELDTFVPAGDEFVPYVWVEGDVKAFERTMAERSEVAAMAREAETPGRVLYHLEWRPSIEELLRDVAGSEITLLSARADHSGWEYRVRAPSHEAVSRHVEGCEDHGLDVSVRRLVSASQYHRRSRRFGVSDKQRRAIEFAAARGYFESPREVTLTELAADLEISQQALSSRIQRGVNRLVRNGLLAADDRGSVGGRGWKDG